MSLDMDPKIPKLTFIYEDNIYHQIWIHDISKLTLLSKHGSDFEYFQYVYVKYSNNP